MREQRILNKASLLIGKAFREIEDEILLEIRKADKEFNESQNKYWRNSTLCVNNKVQPHDVARLLFGENFVKKYEKKFIKRVKEINDDFDVKNTIIDYETSRFMLDYERYDKYSMEYYIDWNAYYSAPKVDNPQLPIQGLNNFNIRGFKYYQGPIWVDEALVERISEKQTKIINDEYFKQKLNRFLNYYGKTNQNKEKHKDNQVRKEGHKEDSRKENDRKGKGKCWSKKAYYYRRKRKHQDRAKAKVRV